MLVTFSGNSYMHSACRINGSGSLTSTLLGCSALSYLKEHGKEPSFMNGLLRRHLKAALNRTSWISLYRLSIAIHMEESMVLTRFIVFCFFWNFPY
jgi:hypothetical protein